METLRKICKKKLLAAHYEHAVVLIFIDIYHSDACWKTAAAARKTFDELGSETAKREAVKDQIRIRVNVGKPLLQLGESLMNLEVRLSRGRR